jgi:hypothetical protein
MNVERTLGRPHLQVVNEQVVPFDGDPPLDAVDVQRGGFRPERDVIHHEREVHRLVVERHLRVKLVDALGDPEGGCRVAPSRCADRPLRGAIVDSQLSVGDANRSDRNGARRTLALGFLLLLLDKRRQVPAAVRTTPQGETRLGDPDVVDHQAAGDEVEHAVIDLKVLHRHDALAGDIDRDVAEIESEKEIPAEAADRQLSVQVLRRLAHDVLAQPVLEPRRLRHDQGDGHDADNQGADKRHDLGGPSQKSHLRTPVPH